MDNEQKKFFAAWKETITDHVKKHRVAYTAIASIAGTSALHVKLDAHRVGEWNTFLAEKGLLEEFYRPE